MNCVIKLRRGDEIFIRISEKEGRISPRDLSLSELPSGVCAKTPFPRYFQTLVLPESLRTF